MTHRQKLIVAVLAIANGFVIYIAAYLLTHASDANPLPQPVTQTTVPAPTNSVEPTTATPRLTDATTEPTPAALPAGTCQWKAAQLTAQAGLGGTVTVAPGGALRFEIAHTLGPGQSLDDAAQVVWQLFDVASALHEQEPGCPFSQVEITISVRGGQTDARITANVSAADLAAYRTGQLSESEFAERANYTVDNQ